MEKQKLKSKKIYSPCEPPFLVAEVEGIFLGKECPKGSKLFLQPVEKEEINKLGKKGFYYCQYKEGGFFGEFFLLEEMLDVAKSEIVQIWRWKGCCSIPVY